jgi:pyruvate formate lyase activating enzyme
VDLREAMHYQRLDDGLVQCQICFRECIVSEGKLGFCANRKNVGGTFYSLIHSRPCALQVDPIEKEPVYHVLPAHTIFCVGTASCNSRCKFCQNWEMSQRTMWQTVNYRVTPAEVVDHAKRWDCAAVSFTYNEPTVFYEYMYDVAGVAREKDLHVVCHSNGAMLAAPLELLLERLDAITVDLKAFTREFYQRVCTLELEAVLSTLQRIASSGVHLEIVNLVIPTLNDDLEDIRRMCGWIVENLGPEVPLHFTRFFPAYRMQHLPATPIETLERAVAIGDEAGLRYVYLGNAPGHKRNSTFCPQCGERIIHRQHFAVQSLDVVDGKCRFCGHPIAGIWEA